MGRLLTAMTGTEHFFQLFHNTGTTDEIGIASIRNDNYSIVREAPTAKLHYVHCGPPWWTGCACWPIAATRAPLGLDEDSSLHHRRSSPATARNPGSSTSSNFVMSI